MFKKNQFDSEEMEEAATTSPEDSGEKDNPDAVSPEVQSTDTDHGDSCGLQSPLEPEDLTKFAIQEGFQSTVTKKVLTAVQFGKPPREMFVRTHHDPSFWQIHPLFEIDQGRKTYYLYPEAVAVIQALGDKITYARLVLTVDLNANPRIWPVKVSDSDLDWFTSALRIAEMAQTQWVRLRANTDSGCYEAHVAEKLTTEPSWPDEEYNKLLLLAFGDRIIRDGNHPVIKSLRGE